MQAATYIRRLRSERLELLSPIGAIGGPPNEILAGIIYHRLKLIGFHVVHVPAYRAHDAAGPMHCSQSLSHIWITAGIPPNVNVRQARIARLPQEVAQGTPCRADLHTLF